MTVTGNILQQVMLRQRQAADPDVSVFVSANAGSGKTHVLAQRVINLLLRGVDPATILCITFTKAAAANMSNRVFKELLRWTALDDAALDADIKRFSSVKIDAATRARARRLFAMALETPGGLKVQTIHAFCTRLLHQFPFEADVAARFAVLDDAATRQLFDQLLLNVLLDATAHPDGPLGRALADVIVLAADQTFKDIINDAIKARDRLTAWVTRAGSVDQAIAELDAGLGAAPGDSMQAIDNEYFSGPFVPRAKWPALTIIFQSGSANDNKMAAVLAAAQAASGHECAEAYRSIFLTNELKPRKNILTKNLAKSQPGWDELLLAEQQRILQLLERERAVAARDRTRALLTIAFAVIERYRVEKERRALLDYDDLIEKTLRLLQRTSAAWVLYKLDAGIDHVLIDEAQDTSPQQWQIIKTIVSEFSPGGARPNTRRTLFAVGDEKQSIFSFQGALPRTFDQMRRAFEMQFRIPEMGWRYVRLEHSFRSGENVLSSVDRVFHDREIFPSITSDAAGVTPHQALPDAAPGVVEIWPPVMSPEKRELEAWDAPFDTTSESSPAVRLAEKIAGTVAVWQTQGTRPGEVLILVRQRNALFEAIIRALKQKGIAVAGADRLVLTEHIAVMDLLVLADALLLPDDDLALATVLRSPLFDFDEKQLFTVAWNRNGSLRAALRSQGANDPVIAAAAQALDELDSAARQLPPFDFYANVLGARGGRQRFLSRLGPEAADALDEFLNLALDYESRETPSLQGFVHWLRCAQSEIKRDMEMARDEVRVMTVHGAKGLEARNVILADTTSRPTGPRDPRLLTLPLAGAAPDAIVIVWATAKANDTEAIGAARLRAQSDAQDEHRRLLYVAMTRAAERLVVCGVAGKKGLPAGCWYDLVLSALQADCIVETADTGDDEVLRYYKTRPSAAQTVAIEPVTAAQSPPPWLDRLVTAEPLPPRLVTPSDSGGDFAGNLYDDFSSGGDRRTALQRGTLMHRLLQSLPDLAPDRRNAAAGAFLARAGGDFSPADRETMLAEVLRLLSDERFAALFAPGSRAEASIVGRLAMARATPVMVAGQVDRLAVTDSEVLIADYKTNRLAPNTVADAVSRYPHYLRQLALYRAVLGRLYPDRRIRAALIWTEVPDLMEFSSETLDAALAQVTSA